MKRRTNGEQEQRRRPAGFPVGRALFIRPGIANDDLREAVTAINRVHGDGVLPRVALSYTQELIDSESGSADGRMAVGLDAGGQLIARSIQIRSNAPNRQFVVLHEIGHVLNLNGLPGPYFSSRRHPVLREWRRAVVSSRAVQELERLAEAADLADRNHARRLSDVTELWARSYAQFVSTRSENDVLRRSLIALRERFPDTLYWPRQWDDDDFALIEVSIGELFRGQGWMT